jgi:4-amino-4-deoxy-L-arabinose transferase-like glycosyltransferase
MLVLLGALFLPNLGAFGLWDPWETHYGEVSRNMVESYDWISPYWGYRNKVGPQGVQGSYFYSKPILIFWGEALSIRVIGYSEWAIRLPMALFALLSCFFAYYGLSKLWGRGVGITGALVLATAPQFFFLARQAQTDMMFVGPLTIAMVFLMLGLFGPWEGRISPRRFWWKTLFFAGVFLLAAVPQMGLLITDLEVTKNTSTLPTLEAVWVTLVNSGIAHAVFYALLSLIFLTIFFWPLLKVKMRSSRLSEEQKDLMIRRGCFLVFLVMAGLATLGKGLLGFMLPGFILVVYILVTNQWRIVPAIGVGRSLLAFVAVALPWYGAMFVKHGNGFYTRFFIHDHFNRLGTGVHQIDSGTFEHFLKWLGIGMFPWVIFVPLALLLAGRIRLSLKTRENQFHLFVFLWFVLSYTLFTIAKTKFHHYIFPALPPMAFLIGKALWEFASGPLTESRKLAFRAIILVAMGLFVALSLNLKGDQQAFRNLFTYKYDRPLPTNLPLDAQAPTSSDLGKDCATEGDCPLGRTCDRTRTCAGEVSSCATDADCKEGVLCQETGRCNTSWQQSRFFQHTTDSVRWALTTVALHYDNFLRIILVFGLCCLALFFFGPLRQVALVLLMVLAVGQTAWGLSHYLPSISPHWSQKYVFENYYDRCGEHLQHLEEEAYRPLIMSSVGKALGGERLFRYFGGSYKRVCPFNITSWLIVWRGETYYSYNELIPLEKKNVQLGPYMETVNPISHRLPDACGEGRTIVCPRKHYLFLENRQSNTGASVAGGITSESKRIARDRANPAYSAYQDLDKWVGEKVDHENDFFTLFEIVPVFKKSTDGCGCADAMFP